MNRPGPLDRDLRDQGDSLKLPQNEGVRDVSRRSRDEGPGRGHVDADRR